jgi:hypothetical protein
MHVRPQPYKMETGHSDPWVATLVAASKASGINILGHWLQGLPLVQPSCGDPRNKRSQQDQPVRAHGGDGLQPPNKHLPQARRLETAPVGRKGSSEG